MARCRLLSRQEPHRARGHGCCVAGDMRTFVLLVSCSFVACVPVVEQMARSKAIDDLRCPQGWLETETFGDRTVEVRGCGQVVVYKCVAGASGGGRRNPCVRQ